MPNNIALHSIEYVFINHDTYYKVVNMTFNINKIHNSIVQECNECKEQFIVSTFQFH